MKILLRTLSAKKNIKDSTILMRVDWNVPLSVNGPTDSLKIQRNIETIKNFQKRGARIILLTHLGRPKKREQTFSTKRLIALLKNEYQVDILFHSESILGVKSLKKLRQNIESSTRGTVHLLENVRFEKGEMKNDVGLAKKYAMLGDIFVNDAFAICHRKESTVVALAHVFKKEAYAGPALQEEVKQLSYVLNEPKKPFLAIIGGKKLSTKIPVLKILMQLCDNVIIGGAMATPFFQLNKVAIGKSFIEKGVAKQARSVLNVKKKMLLPIDVMTTKTIRPTSRRMYKTLDEIGKNDLIVDAGPVTLAEWATEIQKAKTILWNGPIGVTEIEPMGFGSRFIARVIASRTHHGARTFVGGGDTLPVVLEVHAENDITFISTGGGAMLEFIAKKGRLPGLQVLQK